MRPGTAATACVLLGMALIMVGCGGGDATAGGETTTAGARTARPSDASPRTALARKRCARLLGEFLDSAESLDNALAVGLDYKGYLSAVNGVRSTYAAVPAGDLPLGCLTRVAGPAERALNAYIAAANTWGDCLSTSGCETESIEAKLQHEWAQASRFVALAQGGLQDLGTGETSTADIHPNQGGSKSDTPRRSAYLEGRARPTSTST
jgi:hypothetical protein